MTNETATYSVEITLSTANGELPKTADVERLIVDQMSGELDETTGLACLAVTVMGRLVDEGEPPCPPDHDPSAWAAGYGIQQGEHHG